MNIRKHLVNIIHDLVLDAGETYNDVIILFQSAPMAILENHELAGMTLEYRRECGRDSLLQSLTSVSDNRADGSPEAGIECQHLLRLESGAEILRARTEWRPKRAQGLQTNGPILAGTA